MKTTIILFAFLFAFSNCALSQNAIYDAGLIRKNQNSFIEEIDNIKTLIQSQDTQIVKIFQDKIADLENLKAFFSNPLDSSIGSFNINVLSELTNDFINLETKKSNLQVDTANLNSQMKNINEYINNNKSDYENIILAFGISDTQDDQIKSNVDLKIKALKDSLGKSDKSKEKFFRDKIDSLNTIINYLNEKSKLTTIQESISHKDSIITAIKNVVNKNLSFLNYKINDSQSLLLLGKSNQESIEQNKPTANFTLNQSAIIESIYNTIAEQIKTALVNLLFDNISNDKFNLKGELKVIFPESISYLFSSGDPDFTKLNNSLRNSFDADLQNILTNITNDSTGENNYNESIFLSKIRNEYKYEFQYLKLGLKITESVKNNFHPADIISILADADFPGNDSVKYFKKYIQLIDIFQKNLKEIDTSTKNQSNVWIKLDRFDKLFKIENDSPTSTAGFFIGSIYQQLKSIDSVLAKNFKNYFSPLNKANLEKFKKTIKDFLIKLNTIENNLKALNLKSDNKNAFYLYLDNLNNILNAVSSSDDFFNLIDSNIETVKNNIKKITPYINIANATFKSIQTGDYLSVVPQFTNLIKIINTNKTTDDTFKEITKYTDFAIEMVNSKSQSDLNNAVSKAVNKFGGLDRKLQNNFVVSVNSYPGLGAMWEIINSQNNGTFNPGLTMPLGINVQFCHPFAFFAQIFDIAAVANFHLAGNNILPETLTFDQFISPGLFVSLGIKNGFRINIGGAFTPKLRTINNSDINNSKSLRYGINFVYDVPLFHIY